MVNNHEIDIESLYNKTTTAEQIKESFDRLTAPTGRYTFTASKVEALRGPEDHPVPALQEREFLHCFGKMTNAEGKKFGSVGFDASWDVRRTDAGKLDKPSKLWGQLVVALDMKDKPVGEVLNALKQYPVSIYVNESFKTPDGYRTARTDEERKDYRRAGYNSRNFVESISRG